MRIFFFLFVLMLLGAGCRKDGRERLFEMPYPNFDFEVPAGFSPTRTLVFLFDNVNTNFDFFAQQNSADTSAIYAISPYAARITSLDNQSYYFTEQVSVRICPDDGQECSFADEVFYVDNLQGRADNDIQLLPSLRNVKPLLSGKRFRMEVVFFLNDFTPYSVSSRLDMSFEAVR